METASAKLSMRPETVEPSLAILMKSSPGSPFGIEADGDVALVVSNFEFVRDRHALFLQAVTDGARRSVEIFFFNARRPRRARASSLVEFAVLVPAAERGCDFLAAVAIDGDRFQAQLPGLDVGVGDVFDARVLGEIDGLGDGSGDEGLSGRHHLQVAHVVDGARALGGLEGAIEDGEMLVLDVRRAFDGAGGVDVADDGVGLLVRVAEFEQSAGHGVIDDLDHAAADQFLVLNERQVGLDAGGVAVHEEADGAGGGEDRDLAVAVAVLFAVGEGFVPALLAGFVERGGDVVLVDVVDLSAVHADYVEERLAVEVVAGAGCAGHGFGRLGYSEARLHGARLPGSGARSVRRCGWIVSRLRRT